MIEASILYLVGILGGLYTYHDTRYRGQKTIYGGWFSFSTMWSSGLLVNILTYKGNSQALLLLSLLYLWLCMFVSICLCYNVCVEVRTVWQWVLSLHRGGSIGCWAWWHTLYAERREKSIKWDYRSWKNGSAVNSARQRSRVADSHL